MTQYYVCRSAATVFVKEAEFFKSQGGLTQPWGKHWYGPIEADSIHEARCKGFEHFGMRMTPAQRHLSATHEASEARYRRLLPERSKTD